MSGVTRTALHCSVFSKNLIEKQECFFSLIYLRTKKKKRNVVKQRFEISLW